MLNETDSTLENLNSDWLFTAPDGTKKTLSLPHAWNSQGWTYDPIPASDPAGTGVYEKILTALPEGDPAVKFEGVCAHAKVFLNGKMLCEHYGAYGPFTVPLENLRRDGNDLLRVEVTDKATLPDLPDTMPESIFHKSPRYQLWRVPRGSTLKAGGIWRNVYLVRSFSQRMDDLAVESFMDELLVTATLPAGMRLALSMKGASVNVLSEGPAFRASVRMEKPELYSFHNPKLYPLEAELFTAEGRSVQKITRLAAFREFAIRNCEFYLNGKPYFLRGQNGFPHCDVPHDREYIEKYVTAYKAQGAEISRFHTEPPTHAWLDECDRQGIMIIFEMGIHGSFGCYPYDRKEFVDTAKQEMLDCVKEYRRHPSIVMWSLGNEMMVACDRDAGLCTPLFRILRDWTDALHELDPRPVIASSNGDGVDIERSTVGDVDSFHQYGGWYVETLADLKRFSQITPKHDTTSQPMIVTESVAAYTGNDGKFYIRGSDVRQKKVLRQRMGRIDATADEQQDVQAFILKEYAETLWRQHGEGTSLSGYIPFGQYTWFFNPFDKGPEGIRPKKIWTMFKRVLGPCHIHLECTHRHIFEGEKLPAKLRIYHENVLLPDPAVITAVISQGGKELFRKDYRIAYHASAAEELALAVDPENGNTVDLALFCGGKKVGENILSIAFGKRAGLPEGDYLCYDPANALQLPAEKLLKSFDRLPHTVVIGPYAYDRKVQLYAEKLMEHARNGGTVIVMEQDPGNLTKDVLGIRIIRKLQPYWSRWARNLNRYTDRADMASPGHKVFQGLKPSDLEWWNGDTYIAHAYISNASLRKDDRVVMSVCDGLADNELMPVEYADALPDTSTIMLERPCGRGKLVFSQALAGSKRMSDPFAAKLFANLVSL